MGCIDWGKLGIEVVRSDFVVNDLDSGFDINIFMDGEIPFGEGSAFVELERDTQIDNIVLDWTDSLGSDAGYCLVLETGFFFLQT